MGRWQDALDRYGTVSPLCLLGELLPAHLYNRAAFASVHSENPLLRTYCRLVSLELRLKDQEVNAGRVWPSGHDVPELLDGVLDRTLDSLSVQLQQRLGKLVCTTRKGGRAPINHRMFPHLRYLQHQDDFSDGSVDADLSALDDILDAIEEQLMSLGWSTP